MEEFDKIYDVEGVEAKWKKYWQDNLIYKYDSNSSKPVFCVDTPPPYVSAAHLHVGHAMSYTQAEIIVRYKRMTGYSVFYPMGFDDNGLPTERYVETKYKVKASQMARTEFVELCLKETREGIESYKQFWQALGLSVDWDETYSTIAPRAQRVSQKSFLDLWNKGKVFRRKDPIQWCPTCATSLAQADIESIGRKGKLYDLVFRNANTELIIATTRPELLAACVALYFNPQDARYSHLLGQKAVVPLFGHEVEIRADEDVDMSFGTGLMMVCTFGDIEDVQRYRRDRLLLRLIIDERGRLNEMAAPFNGLPLMEARAKIIKQLTELGLLRGERPTDQNVSIHERCETPVEFFVAPQWFISVLDIKKELLQRGEELNWNPEFMKVRYSDWVEGLKWDWNISRQRFYGVPFPVWYCAKCGETIVAKEESLPVDPMTLGDRHGLNCGKCGSTELEAENDVMDTWMTSSLTPYINAAWGFEDAVRTKKLFPATLRIQAFEIIRTWLFYSVVKAHYHSNALPWKDVMISGWGLNENGKKISKRDLESSVGADGFNKYDPYQVVKRYGADSLRYWATGASLGQNLKYTEKDIQKGKRLLTKLWNASRLVWQYVGEEAKFETLNRDLTSLDMWILNRLAFTIEKSTAALEAYEYSNAREVLDRFFWNDLCDNYLEMIKDRFWNPGQYEAREGKAAKDVLLKILRETIAMYAIFLPFITEELYQKFFAENEGVKSIHLTRWPQGYSEYLVPVMEGELLVKVVQLLRVERVKMKLANSLRLKSASLDCGEAAYRALKNNMSSLKSALRAHEVFLKPVESVEGELINFSEVIPEESVVDGESES